MVYIYPSYLYTRTTNMKIKVVTSLLLLSSVIAFGQKKFTEGFPKTKMEYMPGREIVCPASHVDENTYRGYSEEVKRAIAAKKRSRPGATESARFVVDYDSNMPEQAKEAFQRAVDIWAALLNSSVQVNVLALWQELGPNVLGSAGPNGYYRDFDGAPVPFTYYPVALAEKLSGKDINSVDSYDIVARFSSQQNWYYGTTGTPAVNQFDFTSVVLHELCHGLGFVGSLGVQGTQGYYGLGSFQLPVIFDAHVLNEDKLNVTDTLIFANPSTALRNELISENLFFDSRNAELANNGERVRLYAPTVFNEGSSIFHLDDKTFPAGTENSLMTSAAGIREINYDPGPITIQIMNEMGWRATTVSHTPLKDFVSATEIPVSARILSDTTLIDGSANLNYFIISLPTGLTQTQFDQAFEAGMANPTKVAMTRFGSSDTFTGVMDVSSSAGQQVFVGYFITVDDADGKTAVSPATMPDFPHYFYIGQPDLWGPSMYFEPYQVVRTGVNLPIIVDVQDDYQEGVDTVYVEYEINGISQPPFGLHKLNPLLDTLYSQGQFDASTYLDTLGIPALQFNDQVTYRIISMDASGNPTIIPQVAGGPGSDDPTVEDEFELVAASLLDPVEEYFADFDSPTEDFAMIGFDIDLVSGLTTPSLHTRSPYKNGLGLYEPTTGNVYMPFENEAIALLRKPITLSASNGIVAWDEIVLVEPGEDGSAYGDDNFWDYVVPEISVDGSSWFEIMDGYDSGGDNAWNQLFTSTLSPSLANGIVNPTSNGTPTQALYRTKEVNLNDAFPDADLDGLTVLFRFRLHADQWANGWGWTIDNLAIQAEKPAPLATESELFDLKVSPNPSSDFIDLSAKFEEVKTAKVDVFNTLGVSVYQQSLDIVDNQLSHRIDMRSQLPGTYIVSLDTETGRQTKQVVIVK